MKLCINGALPRTPLAFWKKRGKNFYAKLRFAEEKDLLHGEAEIKFRSSLFKGLRVWAEPTVFLFQEHFGKFETFLR